VTPDEFAQKAGVPRETLAHLLVYKELLERTQVRLNLVGPSTLSEMWNRHFWDSAQLRPLIPKGARRLIDLGSGAGFPGMVLAILDPHLEVHLIEGNRHKAGFLAELARATGRARQVTIHAGRIATVTPKLAGSADVVTARALAELEELLGLAAPLLRKTGIALFPKGAKAEAELTRAGKRWKMRTERIASQSDPSGTILRISDLVRK
jgi:16S rRNA (guanine527-N7)-methyltransferase